MENKICVKWADKNNTLRFFELNFTEDYNIKIDNLDGGIDFLYDNRINSLVILTPLLGKYGKL